MTTCYDGLYKNSFFIMDRIGAHNFDLEQEEENIKVVNLNSTTDTQLALDLDTKKSKDPELFMFYWRAVEMGSPGVHRPPNSSSTLATFENTSSRKFVHDTPFKIAAHISLYHHILAKLDRIGYRPYCAANISGR